MINIVADDTKVKINVEVFIPFWETRTFVFDWECGSRWAAGLLATAMRDAFYTKVKAARAEAYEQGWKDAKAKKSKESWFRNSL
jgi:hypothetical protein